jgi:hypothetical protein
VGSNGRFSQTSLSSLAMAGLGHGERNGEEREADREEGAGVPKFYSLAPRTVSADFSGYARRLRR